ncbi:retrotransposon protein, putative, ty1-copia subclass [Tanacetum coccineum]
MKSYIDKLERLGYPMSLNLRVSLILISLRKEFDSFVQNYNMHSMGKTVNKLHAMLKLFEQTLTKKDPVLHAIWAGKVQKMNNKQNKLQVDARGQNQGKGKSKLSIAPKPKIPPPPKRENPAKDSIFSRLYDDGYVNHFVDKAISVSRNNLAYFSDVPRDGIFEIDLSNPNAIDSSMYAGKATRQANLDSALLSIRIRNAPNRMCLYINAEEHELGDLGEPANYKAALLDPEFGKNVGSKWLFKKKADMDGAVHTFKAHLVANGFTQTYGVDYEETFSPVVDIRTIRILIAITTYYDYEIWKMDVKTALFNGHLSEEVNMEQPEGFVNPKFPNRVWKLKCSIYGLNYWDNMWYQSQGFTAILAVLVTGASQSRQHKSCKSSIAVLFDDVTGMISIVTVNIKEYHSNVLARSQG